MNKVLLLGQIDNIKPSILPNDTQKVEFTIIQNEKYTHNKEEKTITRYHKCEAFGSFAKYITKYAENKQTVLIEGSVETQNWEHNGKKYEKTIVKLINSKHSVNLYGKNLDN